MATSTVSSKYQIVIPKELREKLQIKPGQRISLRTTGQGKLEIDTNSSLDQYVGSLKGVYGDPDKYISDLRNEWEYHQKELDSLWDK